MKSILYLLTLVAFLTFMSCYPLKKLPKDLDRSLLLVEMYPTDSNSLQVDGGSSNYDIYLTEKQLNRNIHKNEKLASNFKSYPFRYKLCKASELYSNVDTGLTYIMRYGNVSSHVQGNAIYSVRDIVLENYHTTYTYTLSKVTTGIAGLAPKFVRKSKKL